jgi:crotonobetaine/carnitine-CoA ligase
MGLPRHHPDPGVPRTQARVVDEHGRQVAPGVAGELVLRSPATMTGYWADPQRSAEALRDGWLYTGDSAYQDGDGFFYFVDRKKDIVRRRGENVSSLEVERVLSAHPGIAEAAVVGAPSEFTDEEIVAYVVPAVAGELSAADVQQWCATRLASFKVPAWVEFVTELPKTATAKVRKSELRELAHRAAAAAGASRAATEG